MANVPYMVSSSYLKAGLVILLVSFAQRVTVIIMKVINLMPLHDQYFCFTTISKRLVCIITTNINHKMIINSANVSPPLPLLYQNDHFNTIITASLPYYHYHNISSTLPLLPSLPKLPTLLLLLHVPPIIPIGILLWPHYYQYVSPSPPPLNQNFQNNIITTVSPCIISVMPFD